MAITTITNAMVSVNAIQGTLIADNAITAVHIATNAVSGTLIADNAVTATHIAQNTITVTQLADDAVEADKIADGVITTNHLNKAMISSQTEVTAVAGDFLLIGDTSDSNNLKKIPISGITNLVSSNSISDADSDTKVQVEESSDEDIIRFDVGGTEYMTLTSNGKLNVTEIAHISSGSLEIGNGDEKQIFDASGATIQFQTADTERMRIASDGNVGIGETTPLATLHIKKGDSGLSSLNAAGDHIFLENTGANGTGITLASGNTSNGSIIFGDEDSNYRGVLIYDHSADAMKFVTAGSERMRIDSNGTVQIGSTTAYAAGASVLHLHQADATSNAYLHITQEDGGSTSSDGMSIGVVDGGANAVIRLRENGFLATYTNNTERTRLTSTGNLLIGTSSDVGVAGGGLRLTFPSNESDGDLFFVSNGGGSNATPVLMYVVQGESFNSSHGAMAVGRHTGNNRSINAGGTINASGADYAEYMVKSSGCGDIAKGDVVGVDADGKLTKKFGEAKSFVIKSTDPSYVGGDTWWTEKEPEPKYTDDTKSTKTDDFKDWETRMEAARVNVDRIAFSGQVPVNITGSFNVGDYVYPQVNSSGIKAVAKSTPTFEEYQLCVGKIWTIMEDGRPLVAVKIG